MKESLCYCGHDCARCLTYLATIHDDESLRERAQKFYSETFGLEIPLDRVVCHGGRSEHPFYLCAECPFAKCCNNRGIASCTDCPKYSCDLLKDYQGKYVNRVNQIDDHENGGIE